MDDGIEGDGQQRQQRQAGGRAGRQVRGRHLSPMLDTQDKLTTQHSDLCLQDDSEQATFTLHELVKIQHHLLASDDPKDAKGQQHVAVMSLACMRGDHARAYAPADCVSLPSPSCTAALAPPSAGWWDWCS